MPLGAGAGAGAALLLLRLLTTALPPLPLLPLLLLGLGGAVPGASAAAGLGLPESVIWAINAGGEAHVDVHGIHFRKDPLEGRVGRASDYGMKLPILRANPEDQILYQTERYNEETFGYEVPIKEEGDYVLVLKFAEVYFAQSQQKRCQSCSLTQAWRKRRRRKRRKNMKTVPTPKGSPIRTGSSRAPGLPTPTPPTTAASCFPSWWPLGSSSRPSSASVGCEDTGPS
ncbi:malectin isoform X2 [Notamacropus eugenii]|uniref:malectin isoform X2 n=1 Tax=Notamacropus eugenii TaxID=9315 RepID=UPI003B67BC8B